MVLGKKQQGKSSWSLQQQMGWQQLPRRRQQLQQQGVWLRRAMPMQMGLQGWQPWQQQGLRQWQQGG